MEHTVKVTMPEMTIPKSEMTIKFSTDEDGILGKLIISKGTVKWKPRNAKNASVRMSISEFANMMNSLGEEE